MKPEDALEFLKKHGKKVIDTHRLPNDTGHQIRLSNGLVVNVFDTGNWNVQGKGNEKNEIEALLSAEAGASFHTAVAGTPRRVFVVYGHDDQARNELDAMLRRWDLEPLFLDKLPSEGATIIEKLEKYQCEASFAIVLATPDDEGHRRGVPEEKACRARQNVVLELGMVLAVLGRKNVAILMRDADTMEKPSDIQGLVYIPFSKSVTETTVPLVKELAAVGIKVDVIDL